MKLLLRSLISMLLFFVQIHLFAQCGSGYTSAAVNWDALDYLPTTAYSNTTASTVSPNQFFALGKNRMNIAYATCTSPGENTLHTGETGTYGAGADVQYTGNGTITISFTIAVTNLKFSVYDIDKGQVVAFAAANGASPVSVTVAKASAASNEITISGSTVTSVSGNQSESANTTTVNVDVAGPVTSVTMTVTNSNTRNGGSADSDFWLSDISACVTSTFPVSYYAISRPFTGMPGYVLVAANKSVYMVNPATGAAKFIFSDGATSGTINSIAYDPYKREIYYCWSLTNNGSANASQRALRKYSFATGATTIITNDVTSLGIPTFDQGTESGGAAFYDGALYLGIEGGADNTGGGPRSSTGKESIIWRIDFDENGVPVSTTQVWAVSGDTHDWSDFSISNGILYDFNGDAGNEIYYHYNMQTGVNQTVPYSTTSPKQSAVGWNDQVYWVSSGIAPYNLNGSIGTQVPITATPAIPNFSNSSSPSFGDAAEAYRPLVDFGDAPASYDPDPLAPALHETTSDLRLGASSDVEWDKTSSATANADGSDEDGLPYVQVLTNGGNYYTDLYVFNNTGANATVCAWMDFNGNGVFETGEGVSQTVPSSNTMQTIQLFWPNVGVSLASNSFTFLRIRITSATNGMTTANPTGYFSNGEVEDYYVIVNAVALNNRIIDFSATKQNGQKVVVKWKAVTEQSNTTYILQRSADMQHWTTLTQKNAVSSPGGHEYVYMDEKPLGGISYYRLHTNSNQPGYSEAKKVEFPNNAAIRLSPNPAKISAQLSVQVDTHIQGRITVYDMNGREVHRQQVALEKGSNTLSLRFIEKLPDGTYQLQLNYGQNSVHERLVVRH